MSCRPVDMSANLTLLNIASSLFAVAEDGSNVAIEESRRPRLVISLPKNCLRRLRLTLHVAKVLFIAIV